MNTSKLVFACWHPAFPSWCSSDVAFSLSPQPIRRCFLLSGTLNPEVLWISAWHFPCSSCPICPTSMITFFRNEDYFIFVSFALPSIVLGTCLVLEKIVIELKFQGDIDEIIWINSSHLWGNRSFKRYLLRIFSDDSEIRLTVVYYKLRMFIYLLKRK